MLHPLVYSVEPSLLHTLHLHYCTLHQPSVRVHMLSPPSVLYFRLHPHCVLCWNSLSPLCYHLLDQSLLHPPCVFYTQCCTHLVCIYTLHMLHPPCVLYTQCCTHLVCIYTLHMLNPPCVLYTQCCTNLLYCTLYVAPTLCIVHSTYVAPTLCTYCTLNVAPTFCIVHSMLHPPCVRIPQSWPGACRPCQIWPPPACSCTSGGSSYPASQAPAGPVLSKEMYKNI